MAKKKPIGRPKTKATIKKEKLETQKQLQAEQDQKEKEKVIEENTPKPTQFELAMRAGKKLGPNGEVRAVVMTQAGSEIVDEARRTNSGKYFDKDVIFKPKG